MAGLESIPAADFDSIFAARGWLAEHPVSFRSLIVKEAVLVRVSPGDCVFRRDDESNGIYGVVSGAIGIEGGHRRQRPVLGHILRPGDWFGLKAVLHGGPRELTDPAIEPTRLMYISGSRLVPMMRSDTDIAMRVGQLAEIGNRLGSWIVRDPRSALSGPAALGMGRNGRRPVRAHTAALWHHAAGTRPQ